MKLLLAALIFCSRAHAVDVTKELLAEQLVEDATQRVSKIGAPADRCSSPIVNAIHPGNLLKPRRETVIHDESGTQRTLSILTEKEANEVLAYVRADDSLVSKFTEDGCEQRAIETVRILRGQGLRAEVIGAFPAGPPGRASFKADFPGAVPGTVWMHHFAPIIAVQENGRIVEKVIDPLLSKTPLTKVQWRKMLQARCSSDEPIELYLNRDNPNSEDAVEKANAQLRFYRETQKKREELIGH